MPLTALPSNADPALAAIIAQVESSGSDYALRFEPTVMSRLEPNTQLDRIARINVCSDMTARVIFSTSWGRYQIMGFNLYGPLGVKIPVLQFCADTNAQHSAFAEFLSLKNINVSWASLKSNPAALAEFAVNYNGDASTYSVAMLRAARELGL